MNGQSTRVLRLGTNKELFYSLPPAAAVVAAYEQGKDNWNTWTYLPPEEHPEVKYGPSGRTVLCGDYAAMLDVAEVSTN